MSLAQIGRNDATACPSCGRLAAIGYRNCPWCAAPLPPPGFSAIDEVGPGSQLDFGWAMAVLDVQLGEGGMGVVYHAWLHPRGAGGVQPPLEAAVKVLHPTYSQQGRMREMFAKEAQVLSSLAHPNVVRFYGIGDVAGTSAIAMEYVRGETLASLIERKVRDFERRRGELTHPNVPAGFAVRALPCLPFDRAWHYFQQLLGALAATHALGVVHRDVKPENVLLRTDGIAKLTDFGIARVADEVSLPTGNMIAGTVAYMSPEQIQGKALDGRSDLYSAGVVLFELLTGQLPFPVEHRTDWMVACDHVQTPPPNLRRLVPQAPTELEFLIARALAKDPNERFQTAVGFGDAFRTTLGIGDGEGWRAQQVMAAEARVFANDFAATGAARETPELAAARQRLANAYRP